MGINADMASGRDKADIVEAFCVFHGLRLVKTKSCFSTTACSFHNEVHATPQTFVYSTHFAIEGLNGMSAFKFNLAREKERIIKKFPTKNKNQLWLVIS